MDLIDFPNRYTDLRKHVYRPPKVVDVADAVETCRLAEKHKVDHTADFNEIAMEQMAARTARRAEARAAAKDKPKMGDEESEEEDDEEEDEGGSGCILQIHPLAAFTQIQLDLCEIPSSIVRRLPLFLSSFFVVLFFALVVKLLVVFTTNRSNPSPFTYLLNCNCLPSTTTAGF